MCRIDKFSNIHATYSYFFSKYKTETAKVEQRQLLEKKILHNISKIRNFVTYQITFFMTCQQHKAQIICYRSNSISRDFIFFPPKPSNNESTNPEAIFELRRQKISEVCEKYKMNTGKPSSKIFNSVLCFSQFKVSTYTDKNILDNSY